MKKNKCDVPVIVDSLLSYNYNDILLTSLQQSK